MSLGAYDSGASPFVDRVNAVRFSPDGKTLAVGGGELSRSGDISLWDVATGKPIKTWKERHSDAVLGLDFSPDGKRLASGGADKIARVTDIASGKLVNVFEGHTHHVLGVSFRADGRVLATAGADSVVVVWDMISGERKKKIEGWSKEVTSLQFIGATNQIVTSAGDNLVRIVDDNGGQIRAMAKLPDFMQSAASAATAGVIIGGGEDGLLRVWNGTTGQELAPYWGKNESKHIPAIAPFRPLMSSKTHRLKHLMNSLITPCAGPLSRRGFMRIGLTGFATLSWPGLLRLRAENALKPPQEKTAVIMVWLPGGLSHLDSYDPKPEIGSEYRGPFKTIPTKVPGLRITELLPMQASIADKFTILRSMSHRGPGHPAGSMQMLSGDTDERDKTKPKLPDWMSVANYLRSKGPQRANPLPELRRHQSADRIQRARIPGRRLFTVLGAERPQPAELRGPQHRSRRPRGSKTPQRSRGAAAESRHPGARL